MNNQVETEKCSLRIKIINAVNNQVEIEKCSLRIKIMLL